MKNFAKGVLIGTFGTLAAIASGVFTFHKTVVKPIEDQEEILDENGKPPPQKSRPAHQAKPILLKKRGRKKRNVFPGLSL